MPSPSITCVFHTSPTVVGLLASPSAQPPSADLFVECSPAPSLGLVLGLETPTGYPGIAGLLSGTALASLMHTTDRLPAPVILAPGTNTAAPVIRTALARLPDAGGCPPNVTLLVSTSWAPALGAGLALADQFLLAWDVSEHPHEEMLDFARWLVREQLIERSNFLGVLAYASAPVDPAHRERITTLLAPLATTARPAQVVPLAP